MLLPGGGAHFAVWAPNAAAVSVVGEWNGWRAGEDMLAARWDGSGIWEGAVAAVQRGQAYKYRITSRVDGFVVEKADPYAVCCELPPATASRAWTLEYEWRDSAWIKTTAQCSRLDEPTSDH